tara:strand:+ start:458 stop:640 length:183 start_codon:yes stop_codon:yes gene_type:complete
VSSTVVELSVERLSGVLLGVLTVERVVARERGNPCSVRVCALADTIQAALMLKYNQRKVG